MSSVSSPERIIHIEICKQRKLLMRRCKDVVVVSAIFGDHNKIRQPKGLGSKTLEIVCFFMFIDDITLDSWRATVLSKHLQRPTDSSFQSLESSVCLQYSPPELSEKFEFDVGEMRRLIDAHNLEDRDWLFGLLMQSNLFCPRNFDSKVFVSPDYNQSMEQQREMTMKRIAYLTDRGVFKGWLTKSVSQKGLDLKPAAEKTNRYDIRRVGEQMKRKREVFEKKGSEIRSVIEELSSVARVKPGVHHDTALIPSRPFLSACNLLLQVLDKIGPTMAVLRQDVHRNIQGV